MHRDCLLVARRSPQAFEATPRPPCGLRDVRSAAHRVGEEEGRVGTRLEGRHEGFEARPRETNGPFRETGAERSAPFPAFPLSANGRLAMEGRRGLDRAFAEIVGEDGGVRTPFD